MTWAIYSSQLPGVHDGSDESIVSSTRMRHDYVQPLHEGRWSRLFEFDGRIRQWLEPSVVRACAICDVQVDQHAVARCLIDLYAGLCKPFRQIATVSEDSHA